MAFIPTPGAYYYLVAAHSNKVLEIQGNSNQAGAIVQQAAIKPYLQSDYQQFAFEQTDYPRIFTIKCKGSGLILDVKGSLMDDNVPILQYKRRGSNNQRFRVVDANDGSFYLEAVHSEKVIEIYGEEMRDGMPARQYHNHHTDRNQHQRFYFVIAEAGFTEKNLPTFSKPNQMVREATLGIIKMGPGGGAVSGVVGLFWTDNSLSIVYKQLVQYIESYVENRLEQSRIKALQTAIEGARINLREFEGLREGSEKAMKLTSTITTLNQVDRPFFDATSPEQTLTYLVTIGTIKLALLREQAYAYAKIANLKEDVNQDAHKLALVAGLEEYTVAAQAFRKRALKARLDKVGNNIEVLQYTLSPHNWVYDVSLRDGGDGSVTSNRFGNEFNTEAGKAVAKNRLIEFRKQTVTAQFGAQLDAMIEPARLWKKLNPASLAVADLEKKEIVSATVGPYGTPREVIKMIDGDQIKRIDIWHDSFLHKGHTIARVAGMQITDRWGKTKGMVGHQRGTHQQLELRDGERIVGVYGTASYYLHSLCLETNLGERLRAGDLGLANRFQADLPPELRAHLTSISASSSDEGLSSIQFDWQYSLYGELPEAAALQAPATAGNDAHSK